MCFSRFSRILRCCSESEKNSMVTSAISNFFLLLSYSTLQFFWVFYTKHVWDAIQISFTRLTDGESAVTYGYLSTVGGGGKSFSLSRSFAANNVGIQSPTNHNLTVNATAKMRMNPNQASHPQPGMVNPSTSMITPAPPTKSGRRYCDGFLFGLFIV